ncbi:MAG: proline racemase family protein [Acidobacteria bacterium]|nr:proline racemase family protein [Acidobacteriota bacterium]
MRAIEVVDSHTGGEPTRIIIAGGPELGPGSMAERLAMFRDHHDRFRSAVVNEPRGSDVLVGALLCEPVDPACAAGVIFFNNVGYLGMCGHGTIGLIVTLAHLGRIGPGEHRIETPVGEIAATLNADGSVSIANVPSYRSAQAVINVPGHGAVHGDIAWGGNWFFLTPYPGLADIETLTAYSWAVRQAVNAQGYPEVDHIELYAGNKNFVLCPGKAYDRSPCGTGTSAKLACLAADGHLAPGEVWVQESIIGSQFQATYTWDGDRILPTITGTASITAEAKLLIDEQDPFAWGFQP